MGILAGLHLVRSDNLRAAKPAARSGLHAFSASTPTNRYTDFITAHLMSATASASAEQAFPRWDHHAGLRLRCSFKSLGPPRKESQINGALLSDPELDLRADPSRVSRALMALVQTAGTSADPVTLQGKRGSSCEM